MRRTEEIRMFGKKIFSRLSVNVGSSLRCAHRWMEKSFYSLGCFVSDHAIAVLCISLFASLALSTGLLRLQPEDRYDKLWSTPGSKVDSANTAFAKYFSTPSQPAQVIVTNAHAHDRKRNVLNEAVLLETLRLHEAVLLVLAEGLRGVCQPLDLFLATTQVEERLEKLRLRSLDVSECANINGVLDAFAYNGESILRNEGNLSRSILEHFSPTSLPRQPAALFVGNVQLPADEELSSSPAFRLVYTVDSQFSGDFSLDERFVDAVDKFSAQSMLISAKALGPASLDRETERSLSSDFWIVGISATVLVLFSVLNAGNMICCDPLRSRTMVALCGMLNVALALGASIGLVTYCGVMFSAIQVAMICVVLAIGVDDMFVLCDALARQDPALPRRERVGRALSQVGTSIAMTSTTDAVTFALVAINAVPGVEAFAINATVAVVVDFILQVTFFVACMSLDEWRVDSGRAEILCCIRVEHGDDSSTSSPADLSSTSSPTDLSSSGTGGSTPTQKGDASRSSPALTGKARLPSASSSNPSSVQVTKPFLPLRCVANTHGIISKTATKSSSSSSRQPGEKYLTYLFREKYAPFVVRSRWLRVVAVAVTAALCGASVYGFTQVSSELKLSDTLVDDSFVLRYQELERSYFSSVSLQVDMVLLPEDIAALSTQRQLKSLSNALKSSPSFHPYVVSWFDQLWTYARDCNRSLPGGLVSQDAFSPLLADFFNTSVGKTFTRDIVLSSPSPSGRTVVEAARITAWQRSSPSTGILLQRMESAQHIASLPSPELRVHAYSYLYRFLHEVQEVQHTGHHTVLMSLAVVMVITWFFFEGSFVGAIFCTALIAVVNLNLFGFLPLMGLEYNHASHTVLVIGIGFSVDYIAHLVLAFAKASGKPDERVRTALLQMGSSVFSGSLTTFLGVIPLLFGSVEISRIFAQLICLLIALSAFYGLVVSPVILLCVGKRWRSITLCDPPTTAAYPPGDGVPASAGAGMCGATLEKGLPMFRDVPPQNGGSKHSASLHSASLQQLHIDTNLPPLFLSETSNGGCNDVSVSMTALTASPIRHKPSRPKTKSNSMRTLSSNQRSSQDFLPLYKAVKVHSDGMVGNRASSHTVMPLLPLYSSVRCESSL